MMQKQTKRSRTRRILAIGAALGTVLSVGAFSDSASAHPHKADKDNGKKTALEVEVDDDGVVVGFDIDWGVASMRSGVRW